MKGELLVEWLEEYGESLLSEGEVGRDLGKIFCQRLKKNHYFATSGKEMGTVLLFLSKTECYQSDYRKPLSQP